MNDERAVETFLKLKSIEKKNFSKDKQIEELKRRMWYIAPRPTQEKLLKEAA